MLVGLLLCACIDSNYDLSHIDPATRVEFKNLSVATNLQDITLGEILKPKDGDKFQVIETQEGDSIYAAFISGSFESQSLNIKAFTLKSNGGKTARKTLTPTFLPDGTTSYPLSSLKVALQTESKNLDTAIREIERLGVTCKLNIRLQLGHADELAAWRPTLSGIRIQCPKHLEATPNLGTYDPESGILDLSEETLLLDENCDLLLSLAITSIDCQSEGIRFNAEEQSFHIDEEVNLMEGSIQLPGFTPQTGTYAVPPTTSLTLSAGLTDIAVNTFTGQLEYRLDAFNVPSADFNNLPSFLKDSGTRIRLRNPQIYFELYNPLTPYKTYLEAGLSLTPTKGKYQRTVKIDDNRKLYTQASKKLSTFVLAPVKPESTLEDFDQPEFIRFSGLKDILDTGDGMPSLIKIDVVEAMAPSQRVQDIPLGRALGGIEGFYTFYAPFELVEDSRLTYSDKVKLELTDSLEQAVIRKLSLSGEVTSRLPADSIRLSLTLHFTDESERAMTQELVVRKGEEGKPFELAFDCGPTPLSQLGELEIKGTIHVSAGVALRPSHGIKIEHFKLTADGYYENEQ